MEKSRKALVVIVIAIALCAVLTGCVSNGVVASVGESGLAGSTLLFGTSVSNETVATTREFIFHKNISSGNEDIFKTVTGTSVSDPKDETLVRSGYDFQGWYLNSSCTGKAVAFPYTPDEDASAKIYFYAKWVSKEAIKINSIEGLMQINDYPEQNYVLVSDIDLSGFDRYIKDSDGNYLYDEPKMTDGVETEEDTAYNEAHRNAWIPICGGVGEEFSGTFDGNGKTISNMRIVITSDDQDEEFNYLAYGLFGNVTGSIKNLTIDNVDYSKSETSISYTEFRIDGDCSLFYIGGIAGHVADKGSVSGCTFIGQISNPELIYESTIWDQLFGSYAEPTENTYIGGIVGYLDGGTVSRCSSAGKIISESNADGVYIGGAVGYVSKVLNESTTKDKDTGEDVTVITVEYDAVVSNTDSSMIIKARYAGGLVGYNNGEIRGCFATGAVSGSLSYPAIAGGLVAYNYTRGTIEKCYAEGKASARTAGGLVGVNVFDYEYAEGGTIANAYAGGDVFASEFAGGLIGRAVANLPVNGRDGYSSKIFNYTDDQSSSQNRFFIIKQCLAYGKVEANATQTTFVDYNGKEYSSGVYYPVYAGSVIGQAHELLATGCIGFGTVTAISNRSKKDEVTGEVSSVLYNSAYADNFVGQSSNLISGNDYVKVYVAESVTVTRNDMKVVSPDYSSETGENVFKSYNQAEVQTYSYLNNQNTYTEIGFNAQDWNLTNLDVENGIRPTLNI